MGVIKSKQPGLNTSADGFSRRLDSPKTRKGQLVENQRSGYGLGTDRFSAAKSVGKTIAKMGMK